LLNFLRNLISSGSREGGADPRSAELPRDLRAEELVVLDPGQPAQTSGYAEVDPVTEQFRSIRANLLALPLERRPRCILMTSARSGEGTTHTVHRLGASLADRGDLRVLLVDANLRQPRLDAYLEDETAGGMTEILRGDGSIDDWIEPTDLENLDILPAGSLPGNPAELLATPVLREVLRAVREGYDFVLVDSPAVGHATDAAVLGASCDAALLVVRLNTTARAEVASALDALGQAGVGVMGCILTNDPEVTAARRRRDSYGETRAGRVGGRVPGA